MYFDVSSVDLRPEADPRSVVQGKNYRFTVLTPRLIRMEYSESGAFEDRATAFAVCRKFPVPEFSVSEENGTLRIETEALLLEYDGQPFGTGLTVLVKRSQKHKAVRWHYGMEELTLGGRSVNLGGTARTLDVADGRVPLGKGLMSIHGFSVVEDSDSLLWTEDGWFEPRSHEETDLYFFGYLSDFTGALQEYYRLSGASPMLPRYAFGNWWSRYYKYTENSYLELMKNFAAHKIPLSVAVIDMDWHPVDIDPEYGNGWTGYSWNRNFFPDPERFLKTLHRLGLKVTMNLHPADGVRAFEDRYPALASALGMDPEKGETVQFDAANPKSLRGLLDHVLAPLEKEGVDFWWLDWQQAGGTSDLRYDPLFILNHCFYLKNAEKGTYPLNFSRYAGPGSQRYPIGFSGDTFMTWASLDFQPEFTATASNVGFGWWSHDIGGHMRGIWDNELQIRWLQYGVFSPILRLHSAKNTFLLKEPWNFPAETEKILSDQLRLRHRLVPYLYTMNYRNHAEGIPLVRPLYYEYGKPGAAVHASLFRTYRNEYLFGSELLVCPITTPSDRESMKGRVTAWIPEGDWFDFTDGRRYRGEKELELYRGRETYPVLAKAGAIVPLSEECEGFGTALPKAFELRVFAGKDGVFRMYEDNESLKRLKKCVTEYRFSWRKKSRISIRPAEGDLSILPKKRAYRVTLFGASAPKKVRVITDGIESKASYEYDELNGKLSVRIPPAPVTSGIDIVIDGSGTFFEEDWRREIGTRLPKWQTENQVKQEICDALSAGLSKGAFLAAMLTKVTNRYILGEITEIVTAGE